MEKQIFLLIFILFTINYITSLEENVSLSLCNKTYDSALKDFDVNETILMLENETWGVYHESTVMIYLKNWQDLCSDLLNKTLNPREVCNRIYYFIIKNNYNYSSKDVLELRESLNESVKISQSVLNHYIDYYWYECYSKGYSPKPPKKPIPTLTIIKEPLNISNCSLSINSFFDASIPTPNMNIGELDCSQIKSLKWFLSLEDQGNHFIRGIKIWWIGLLIILFFLLILYKIKNKKVYIEKPF